MSRGRWIGLAVVVLVGVALQVGAYHHYPWDYVPGFYALFGLVSCWLIVVVSKAIGTYGVFRAEDYYDR